MKAIAVLLGLGIIAAAPASAQRILGTAAGGDAFFRNAGQPAAASSFGRMTGLTLDPAGRPVFADPYFHLVLRGEADGTVTVIAGNNIQGLTSVKAGVGSMFGQSGGGFSGDGGPPTQASLNQPHSVAFDSAGFLYIADSGNNRIRKVDLQNNVITTFAGNGQVSFGGDNGDPLKASLNYPIAVALDPAGNVYINDAGNYRIRKISAGGNINTIAGTGKQGDSPDGSNAATSPLDAVEGIAADTAGNLYIAEAGGNKIRKITTDGKLVTIAGNGSSNFSGDGGNPLSASLSGPSGVAIDASNNIYIADTNNQVIRLVANNAISTVGGNGNYGFSGDGSGALSAMLWNPYGLAVSVAKEIYIADRDNSRIRKIDAQGNISTIAGDGRFLSSGDGAPATQVSLFSPLGVSLDTANHMTIADTGNSVIRRANADGSLSIIAGNGAEQFDDDHAAALSSGLNNPASVTASGNSFIVADTGNFVLRQFTLGGVMNIIAGNPDSPAPGGENINPLKAGLMPIQSVVDKQGNVYASDFANGRIVKFTPGGTFGTFLVGRALSGVAGLAMDDQGNLYASGYGSGLVSKNGNPFAGGGTLAGLAGDGKPATSLKLAGPSGLATDAAGNIYLADAPSNLVYEITTDGIAHIVAGNGLPGYSGDGGLATAGSLNFPWGLAFDRTSNTLLIADTLNNRIRTAAPVSATFSTSSSSISLSANANGAVSNPVPVDLIPSAGGLLYSVTASSPMLQITPVLGAMPARLQVEVDPTGVAAGTYKQTFTITAPGATPATRTVNVTTTVAAEQAPTLSVATSVLNGTVLQGDAPSTNTIAISNTGGGKLCYSAASSGANPWLTGTAPSDCLTANQTGSVTVTIDPSQLNPAIYTDAITINAGAGGTATVPVNVVVNPTLAKLQISSTGITFTMVQGGGIPLPRMVSILNSGQGSMSWTANKSTDLQLSQDWLVIAGSASGMVQQPYTDISSLQLAIDPTVSSQLTVGTYYGRVEVHVPGIPTQSVTAILNVLDPTATPPPDISTGALIFSGTTGQNPSSQTIALSNVQPQALTYKSARITSDGGNWLVLTPATGTLNPGQPAQIVVQPDFTNLTPGVTYKGKVTLQFSGGTSTDVQVVALASSGAGSSVSGAKPRTSCSDNYSMLYVASSQTPVDTSTGLPTNLEVALLDACNSNVVGGPNSSVSVTFDTTQESSPLSLQNTPTKTWAKSWTPKTAAPKQVKAHFLATVLGTNAQFKHAVLDVMVDLQSGSATPVVANGEIQNGASFLPNAPVAPGSYITLKGSNLGGSTASAIPDGTNLPTQLNGTQVKLGDRFLPLSYAANGQINAQIPYDVNVNDTFEISVVNGAAISTADSVIVAQAQPGIFTKHFDAPSNAYITGDGTGQGDIENQAGQVVDQTAPATANDVINIVCTGLGAVQDATLGDGQIAAKATPTVANVTVTIGGQSANVVSSTLAVGAVGRYIVQAVVPSGVTPGSAVPVMVSAAGRTSQVVTMAIH